MTIEDVKLFLGQVKLYDRFIKNKEELLLLLDDRRMKITASLGGEVVSGSRNQDKLGDISAAFLDLENELKEDIAIYKLAIKQVKNIVDRLEDPDEVDVICKLYFFDKSWEQIAEEMNMTSRNAQYIHGRALISILALMTGVKENEGTWN